MTPAGGNVGPPAGAPAERNRSSLTGKRPLNLFYGGMSKGGVFSEPSFFYEPAQQSPGIRAQTCSVITWRLCGGLGASVTQYLRALRLWQSSAAGTVVRTAVELHVDAAPGCHVAEALSSINILTAWPGRVAQAPRAERARAPWSCTPCWRPLSRTARGWGTS